MDELGKNTRELVGLLVKELVEDLINGFLPECIERNAERQEDYWIVIFLKSTLERRNNKPVFKRIIRIIDFQPPTIVNSLVYRVNPRDKIITLEQPSVPKTPITESSALQSVKSDRLRKMNYLVKI